MNLNDIELKLVAEIQKNKSLPIYIFTLDGEMKARTSGYFKLQIHFEDASQPGGVKHVDLAGADEFSSDDAASLEAWLKNVAKKHPGRYPPRIVIGVAC